MKLNANPQTLIEPISKKWSEQKSFMEEIGVKLVEETQRRIQTTKAGPDGKKWERWAPSTRKARQKEGTSAFGLLLRTGHLMDSVKYNITPERVLVFSNLPYAKYLQNGTSRMPARPFLGNGPREEKVITSIWKKWINT